MFDFDVENNSILVVSDRLKNRLLNFYSNKLLNIKYISLSEFKKNYFFDYNSKTIFYVMKNYNLNYNNACEILKYIYYVNCEKYDVSILDYLVSIKKDLIDNKLLIFNDLFLDYINNKKIYVFYDYLSLLDKKMFEGLNVEFVKYKSHDIFPEVNMFSFIDDEVRWCACKICKLIDDGISINKIKLINYSSEYNSVINRIFKLYNLPIEKDEYLFSTKMVSSFIDRYDNNISTTLDWLKANFDFNDNNIVSLYNQIVSICNKYNWCDNYLEVKDLIINEFKNTLIKKDVLKYKIELVDFNDYFFDDEYVFLLGFNQNNYPKLYKDDDFISDDLKKYILLEDTFNKNKYEYDYVVKKITSIKNLYISYKLNSFNSTFYPSVIIDDLSLNVVNPDISYSYSNLDNKLVLSSYLDNYIKYGSKSDNLSIFYNSYSDILYGKYDNCFKGIDKFLFSSYLDNKLSLSYSSLNNFFKCQFRFYIENILKLNYSESNFFQFIGNLFHNVLSHMYDDDFDFEVIYDNYVKLNYEVKSNKEDFFINKLKNDLLYIISSIKKQDEFTTFHEKLFEHFISIDYSRNNFSIEFKGIIDKILYDSRNELFSIIDYKTGNTNLNLNNIIYGIDMQLSIYALLSKKIDKLSNSKIVGIYLQKILNNEINRIPGKLSDDLKYDNLKLQGYSSSIEADLKLFDTTYTDSKLIKSMKVSSKGFYAYTKIFNKDMLDKILKITESKIDEAINLILNQDFSINPKQIGIKNLVGCEYCNYSDICFMKNHDIVNLHEYKNLEFLGDDDK